MGKVREAYDALQQAIREEYNLEPVIKISFHLQRQKSYYDIFRSGMKVQDDYGEKMKFDDAKLSDGRVIQWVEIGPFTLFR